MVSSNQFAEFFRELWGFDPFPWQQELAELVCEGNWPAGIDVHTGGGKTACLDIAVFALAVQASLPFEQRTQGRRIFFVVNRRVIVDEAFERATMIAEKLSAALSADSSSADANSTLREVALALQTVSGDEKSPPLDVALLRGGIYRDNRWSRSLVQPTIVTSTIDQLGSRLLFRGLGLSEGARPLHAALAANDATILLDEAHISRPFVQTLKSVGNYRSKRWAEEAIETPFDFVQLSATLDDRSQLFQMSPADHRHPILASRREASKPVQMEEVPKARGKRGSKVFATALAGAVNEYLKGEPQHVAVIVNRVETARELYMQLLGSGEAEVYLAIGRMRPIDRDRLNDAIRSRVGPNGVAADSKLVVVATQCLEVGADFDFDAMICECASLSALRQRFGRLNRRGRPITAEGKIYIRGDQVEGEDPIYGIALANTWGWLNQVASNAEKDTVDFGIAAMEAMLSQTPTGTLEELEPPTPLAPTMLPWHLDAWAQTSPEPHLTPNVMEYLHGVVDAKAEVNICWRFDLPERHESNIRGGFNDSEFLDAMVTTVSQCPPRSPECLPVTIGLAKQWLVAGTADESLESDMLGANATEEPADSLGSQTVLAWRGVKKSIIVKRAGDIQPGDTLVLPVEAGGWSQFGHLHAEPVVPDPAAGASVNSQQQLQVDVGEQATQQQSGKVQVRLTPDRIASWPALPETETLLTWLTDSESDTPKDIRDVLSEFADELEVYDPPLSFRLRTIAAEPGSLRYQRYGESKIIVTAKKRHIPGGARLQLPVMDDGDDALSRTTRSTPISLANHTDHVCELLSKNLAVLPLEAFQETSLRAASLHDWGKADIRFQAYLLQADGIAAAGQPQLWAKSGSAPLTRKEHRLAQTKSELPAGFRHELLSVQLAQASEQHQEPLAELLLYLIGAHHGRARPLPPVVLDPTPPQIDFQQDNESIRMSSEDRSSNPPHRLDSGFLERFWLMHRRYGWWGIAYLEASLRLADQQASRQEDEGYYKDSGHA